jgi:hypothetical protein
MASVGCLVQQNQGCQMAYFPTKYPDLGKFRSVLQWNMLVYYSAIWYIWYMVWLFSVPFWYVLVCFGMFWYVVPRKIWQPWSECLPLEQNYFACFDWLH